MRNILSDCLNTPSLVLVHTCKVPCIHPKLYQCYVHRLNEPPLIHLHMTVIGLFPVFSWAQVRVSTNSIMYKEDEGWMWSDQVMYWRRVTTSSSLLALVPERKKCKLKIALALTLDKLSLTKYSVILAYLCIIHKWFVICCTCSFLCLQLVYDINYSGVCTVMHCDWLHIYWGITPTNTMQFLLTLLCYHFNVCVFLPLPHMWVTSTLLLFINQWLFMLWYVYTFLSVEWSETVVVFVK